jgi:hypothetical protein
MNSNIFNKPPGAELMSVKELNNEIKAHAFLGEEIKNISVDSLSNIFKETYEESSKLKEEINKNEGKNIASYNKYKKSFKVGEEENVSMGNIVSAHRFGVEVVLPKELEQSGDGKKVRNLVLEKRINSFLFGKLNKELAKNLAEKTKLQDALKAKAYEQIYERSGIESKQFGVVAEQIIIGTLEGLVIDRPDLGFEIIEANAYQDVQNKIDFIINTKQKRRGVGINKNEEVSFEEKSIGIQFTTNKTKAEHKNDQINKAKERGVEVDDILYVELDNKILQEAVRKWENSGRSISGPWKFLPTEIQNTAMANLFKNILSEEQIKSISKNLK